MTAIHADNLVKTFGDFKAVQGVTFDVPAGETFGLLGPNGAGKSTTISMLSCLLHPTSGDALVMGHSIVKAPQAVKAVIGVVPQDIAIYADLSARENLVFWGKMYGLRGETLRRRIDEVLEIITLTARQKDIAGTFSGGMKRRLNIGIALLHRPPIVIMDEPTVGIDPQSRRSILDSVKALNSQGTTVLYTTHYMEEVAELATHIAILDKGQVIASGTHAELTRIVGEMDRIDITVNEECPPMLDAWQKIDGVRSVLVPNGHITLLAEDSNGVLPRVFEAAGQFGVRITSIDIQEPNLESVFLHLTGRALRD
jgi:ABC-2 type transport system ATP-binding protein